MGMNLNVGIRDLEPGTNIKDIKVPPKLREKHRCGMDWMDDALGGEGFTPGTIMMLTGTPGAGKTTMLLQLADSLTGLGHQVLLNTGEESLYQVRLVTERLSFKHGFIAGQDTMVKDVFKHCHHIMETRMQEHLDSKGRLKVGSKQLFLLVDSLQCMDDGKYVDTNGNSRGTTSATPMHVVEMLTDFSKKFFVNVIFIGQVNKSGEFSGKNGILHCIDTHGRLFFDMDKKSDFFGERMFAINKNRFGCSGRHYLLGMDDKGLFERGRFHTGGDAR
jgi:DNA repair protein RadA/Sms